MVVAKLLVSDGRLHYITQSSLLMWAVRPSQTSTVSQRREQWTDSTRDNPRFEIGRFVFLQQQSLHRSTSMLALVSRTGLKFVIYIPVKLLFQFFPLSFILKQIPLSSSYAFQAELTATTKYHAMPILQEDSISKTPSAHKNGRLE